MLPQIKNNKKRILPKKRKVIKNSFENMYFFTQQNCNAGSINVR